MIWKFALLCVCLQLFSIVIAIDTFRTDDSNIIDEENKKSEAIKVDETFQHVGDGIVRENSKPVDDYHLRKMDHLDDLEFGWLNVPLLPVVWARSSSLPDGPCKNQAQLYLRHLKNHSLWAAQMFDASTKYPDGILSGNTRHLGDFDLCYNLKTNLTGSDDDDEFLKKEEKEIAGRYCLVDIKYEKKGLPPVDPLDRYEIKFDPQNSVWEAIREKGDFRRVRRYVLQMALCVPEVCTSEEIESALQEPFALSGIKQNVHFNVSIKPKFCQAKTEVLNFSLGAKIYCSIVIGLFLLVAISTWYDYSLKEYKENDESTINDLVLCFSARRNFNTLIKITSSHPGLQTIHLTRLIYMTIAIVGHRLMEHYAAPTINGTYIETLYTTRSVMPVLGAMLVVDGFFSIGGLLVAYRLLTQLDNTKKLNFMKEIIRRFLRLTPAYALVVFFYRFMLPHMGSGPFWKWKIGLEHESCVNNWWANLFYINNYVNPENICMFQTWYVAADYQLFILALLVVYAFWLMPRKFGYPFLCLIALGGCVIPFINTYWYNVQPMVKALPIIQEVRDNQYFTDHYVKTHERITAYFIGVIAGAILYDHNQNPWKLSKVCSHVSFILFAVVLSLGSQYTGHKYYDPNQNSGGLGAALYACLHRGAFALSCSSLAVLVTVGQGLTFHYNFLTPRWAQPLGRISYGAYLTHAVIQLHAISTSRTAREFTFFYMFWKGIPDVVCALFLALILSLTVEGPFRRIEKRFLTKREEIKISNKIKEKAKKSN